MNNFLLNISLFTTTDLEEKIIHTVKDEVIPFLSPLPEINELRFSRIHTNVEEGMAAFALSVGFKGQSKQNPFFEQLTSVVVDKLSRCSTPGKDFQYFPTLMEIIV